MRAVEPLWSHSAVSESASSTTPLTSVPSRSSARRSLRFLTSCASSAERSSTEMPCAWDELLSAAKAEVPASVAEATGTAIASTRARRAPTRLTLALRCRRRPPGANVWVGVPSGVPVMK